MHTPTQFIRICVVIAMILVVLALGYPMAFVVQHGWNSAAWSPNLPMHPTQWFQDLSRYYVNIPLVIVTYWEMLHGASPSFAGGGLVEVAVLGCSTIFIGTMILLGGKLVDLRDPSNMYGNAEWASQGDINRLKTTDKRILKLLDKPPPQGFARWTGPLLAEALGDVDVQYVWRFLRSHKIDLAARKSWCESNDPNFTAKAADVVGLYVAPPAKAIVLCVDEKPSIQTLERAQGYLKLPNGRALTGQSHDYKRHGTTTLFAALEVATGKIIATHSKRRRRVEFLDFMNSLTAAFPGRTLHVILDNLNTHKKNEDWLKAHPNVQFHFTPTSASWLNQVEVWFSILQGQSLSGTSFTSLKQLQEHIDAYVNAYNDKAEPFVWTKKKVRQRRFKDRRITQLDSGY
jgi:hypothetical protein